MIVVYTKHAQERMVFRGIGHEEIIKAVRRGAKYIQKPDKIIANYRYFSIAYTKRGDMIKIITVQPFP